MTTTRSLPTTSGDAIEPDQKRKRFGLSWTQIVAAGFASITATVILSFFSISGTLIGAAVFSMASAVGNAVYGQSLRSTKDKVRTVVRADPASPTVVLPVVDDDATKDAPDEDLDAEPTLPASGSVPARTWKRIAIFAAAVFLFVITVVTSVELIAGRPLTDVLRGDKGSGTSLFGGTSGRGNVNVPTVVVTVTPSVKYTTPVVTQTAPAKTQTVTPSDETSTAGTGSSSPSGTTSTTPSTSPSASPSTSQTRAR